MKYWLINTFGILTSYKLNQNDWQLGYDQLGYVSLVEFFENENSRLKFSSQKYAKEFSEIYNYFKNDDDKLKPIFHFNLYLKESKVRRPNNDEKHVAKWFGHIMIHKYFKQITGKTYLEFYKDYFETMSETCIQQE